MNNQMSYTDLIIEMLAFKNTLHMQGSSSPGDKVCPLICDDPALDLQANSALKSAR